MAGNSIGDPIGRVELVILRMNERARRSQIQSIPELLVRVRDNGIGIDPKTRRTGKPGHFGISGMGESEKNERGVKPLEQRRCGCGTRTDHSRRNRLFRRMDTPGEEWTMRSQQEKGIQMLLNIAATVDAPKLAEKMRQLTYRQLAHNL